VTTGCQSSPDFQKGCLARQIQSPGAKSRIPTDCSGVFKQVYAQPTAKILLRYIRRIEQGDRGLPRLDPPNIHVRPARRTDIPGIVHVSNSSILPGEDIGFGGGTGSPFQDASKLVSAWQEPNIVRGNEIWVAEMDGRIVGVTKIEDKKEELELVDIDVPLELQGRGIGSRIVRSIEERATREGKRAVTLGTSRNAEGVPWKSLLLVATLGLSNNTRGRE
jgi:predicted N-acetyltransferase YhbS